MPLAGTQTNMWNKLCIIVGPLTRSLGQQQKEAQDCLVRKHRGEGRPRLQRRRVLSGLSLRAKGIWAGPSPEALGDLSECSVDPNKVPCLSFEGTE